MRSDAGPWHDSREFLSAYISGYVDGEGCFTVSIAPRATLLVGWEVTSGFSVSQKGDRAEVLQAISAYFGCGSGQCVAEASWGRTSITNGRRRKRADIRHLKRKRADVNALR